MENEENNLVELMIARGYDKEFAQKCVDDVLEVRKIARELAMKNYIGKRVKAEFDGLLFEVVVKDVKINYEGKTEIQVTPLNGSKSAWIKKWSL